MKVGVDISSLTAQRTGVGTYVYELIRALADMETDADILGYAMGLQKMGAGSVPTGMRYRKLGLPLSGIHWMWKYLGLPKVESIVGEGVDVVHATNFFLPPVKSAKRVLSVHDISFATHPEWVNAKVVKPYAGSMTRFCDEADGILVFSEFTKSEIVEHYGTGGEKIHVVPHGIREDWCCFDEAGAKEVVEGFGVMGPYVLYVGTIEERKNIRGLLDAFERLEDVPHRLVLAGGMGWLPKAFKDLVDERGLGDRVILPGYVEPESLSAFYKSADAFVFPSHYEGFGFPVLEAFSCDCPVITSNGSSLPEVGGNAAVYVEQSDADGLAEAIGKVLSDSEYADDLREKGRDRVREFTWSQTAEMTMDVYRSVKS